MNSFFRKLLWLARRSDREAELREELAFHLEEEAEERKREGLAEHEARWAAHRELGNLAAVEEDTRAAWGWTRLEQFARTPPTGCARSAAIPPSRAIAIATLALGIGGDDRHVQRRSTPILIRPLPYADADRLVMIWDDLSKRTRIRSTLPRPRNGWSGGVSTRSSPTSRPPSPPTPPCPATASPNRSRRARRRRTSGACWASSPLIGRVFTEEEDEKGVRVAVISYGLWQRRYGGSPDVLGRKITVNDDPYEVIGVMPREFYFMPARDIDIWMPASFPAWMRTNFTWHDATGRGAAQARRHARARQESMAALSLQVTAKDFRGPHAVVVTPLREEMAGKTQTALVVLLCASAALLLIACVNLANLLMSRGDCPRPGSRGSRGAGGGTRPTDRAIPHRKPRARRTRRRCRRSRSPCPPCGFSRRLCPRPWARCGSPSTGACWRSPPCVAIAAALVFGLVPALRGSRISPAGRAARRRPRHGGRAQPLVPAFAHRHRDRPRRGAADERRPAAADLSAPAEYRPRNAQRRSC